MLSLVIPRGKYKAKSVRQVLSEQIPIYSKQQTLGRGSRRQVAVADFNGVWREEDLKDVSLVSIAQMIPRLLLLLSRV